jgi:hypothetical protein
VGAEELVRRAEENIGIDRLHVDRPVRGVVHRVDPRERPCVVRERDHTCHIRDGTDRVRGPGERDDPSAVRQLAFQVREVEPALLRHVDAVNDEIVVTRDLEPRGNVRIVIEPGHDELVPCPQLPGKRPRERKVQGRHVRSETDLLEPRAEKRGRRHVCLLHDELAGAARRERAAEVRVRLAEIGGHRLDDRFRHLGASRAVEERLRAAEGREARPNGLDIERHRVR